MMEISSWGEVAQTGAKLRFHCTGQLLGMKTRPTALVASLSNSASENIKYS